MTVFYCGFSLLLSAQVALSASSQLKEHEDAIKLARRGKENQALAIIEKLIQDKKVSKDLDNDYVVLLARNGKSDQALTYYKTHINPQNAPVYVLQDIGNIYDRQGKMNQAYSLFQHILKQDPHNLEAILGMAKCLIHQKKAPDALKLLNTHENKLSQKIQFWLHKGKALELNGKKKEALSCYKRASELEAAEKKKPPSKNPQKISKKKKEEEEAASPLLPFVRPFLTEVQTLLKEKKTPPLPQLKEHEKAIHLARNGALAQALEIIEDLILKKKKSKNLETDYITLLIRGGQDKKALQYYKAHFRKEKTPIPTLEEIADSYYRQGHSYSAHSLYRYILKKDQKNFRATLGICRYHLNEKQPEEVVQLLKKHENVFHTHADFWIIRGHAFEMKGFHNRALFCYDQALTIDPHNKEARRKRILNLSEAGAPMLALENAKEYPDLFTEDQLRLMKLAQVSSTVRWGRRDTEANMPHDRRYARIDEAIRLIQKTLVPPTSKEDRLFNQKLRFDLIVAYYYRHRYMKCIQEFESLHKDLKDLKHIPDYVILYVAQAYEEERLIDKSRELYEYILRKAPKNATAVKGLYYCLLNKEKHKEALALAEKFRTMHKKFLPYPTFKVMNPNRIEGENTYSVSLLYAEYLDEAEKQMKSNSQAAPMDASFRNNLAALYQSRELPRAAEKELQIGRSLVPEDAGLKISLANTLLTLQDYQTAEEIIDFLVKEYPDSKAVQNLLRRWEAHNKREFTLEAGYNRNYGTSDFLGKQDYYLEGRLYSQPLLHNYRAFISERHVVGTYQEGKLNEYHTITGIEYRARGMEGAVGFNYSKYGKKKAGYFIEGGLYPTDHWRVTGKVDVITRDNPSRAFVNGITSNIYQLGLKYIHNESMSASIGGVTHDYSDHNVQHTVAGRIFKRLFSNYDVRIDATLDLSSTQSKKQDGPYYSPKRDFTPILEATLNHRFHREYEYSFRQLLTVAAGRHFEKRYPSHWVGLVSYAHEINYIDWFSISYGYIRKRASYDGGVEKTNMFYLKFNIRF